jgi:DNA-directed RNA polymerase subunit RPC12/RpoP
MNKKEKTIYGLLDFIQTESYMSYIKCTKCGTVDGGVLDSDENLANIAYSDGWRVTILNCYCPYCSKKFLNKKKSNTKTKVSLNKNGKTEIKRGKKTIGKQG